MMQGVTRNPVAEPSLMGITQGAMFAVAMVGTSSTLYGLFGNMIAALIGALVSGVLVLLFSMKSARNMNLSRLLLAGNGVKYVFYFISNDHRTANESITKFSVLDFRWFSCHNMGECQIS